MNPRSSYDRISVLIVSGLLLLTPLAHSPVLSDPFGLPKSMLVLAGAVLLLLAAVLAALARGPRPRLRSTALYLASAFLACAAIAAALSPNTGLALRGLAENMALVVVAWAVARSVREPRDAARLLGSALAGATFVAAGTIIQVFRPGGGLIIAGLSILPPASSGATLGDPGLAAQFLILALPLGFGAAALSGGAVRLLCGGALGLILAALGLASRPEGWIVTAVVLALCVVTGAARAAFSGGGLRGRLPVVAGQLIGTAVVAATVALAVFALMLAPGVASRDHPVSPLDGVALLAPTSGDPQADRVAALRGSQALLALHPLGVGLSFWRHAFLEVAWTRVSSSPFDLGHQAMHAGNSFLELAAEAGVPGGLLFATLFLLASVQAGRAAFVDPGPWGALGYASLNALLGASLTAFFGSPFQETSPALLCWVAVGATQAGLLRGGLPGGSMWLGVAERQTRNPGVGVRLGSWGALVLWIAVAAGGSFWLASRLEAARRTLAAQSLMRAGDLRGAIAALDAGSIRRSPEHLPQVLLGDACLRSGLSTRAAEAFTAALERSPWFPAAYLGRAAVWEDQGRYDRADQDLTAALAIWPDAPEILLRRARLEARRGRVDASLEGYRAVTRVSKKMADPWCGMGDLYLRLARYDAALEAFLSCINRNPGFPRVNIGLGEAYEKKGLYEMALGYYKRAAAAEEREVEPRLRLANLYDKMGKACDARDALAAARDLEVDTARRAIILGLIDKVEPACHVEQAQQK